MKKNIALLLVWLPAVVLCLFYFPNGWDKLVNPEQVDKIVSNRWIFIVSGVYILSATLLYLYPKTMLWGTLLLCLYMTVVTLIHIYRGKPYEVVALINVATVLSTYIRRPLWFKPKEA